MSKKPSFVFGYWRPWKEDEGLYDNYMDYVKDVSLAKYSADTVGEYISQASAEQVNAINDLGQSLGAGMNVMTEQMRDVNTGLSFVNRNLDILIEQGKLENVLLHNISELLRVPDSEKERQLSIELGIKYFVNAQKDPDLYADALEELLKAESFRKQDYFVLHRIGLIYLYVENFIDPEKALDYFLRAANYASVESSPEAIRLANILTDNFEAANSESNQSRGKIKELAAESYEKAAFAAYVLGRFECAVEYQEKAGYSTGKRRFFLAKYQIRAGNIEQGVEHIYNAVGWEPSLAVGALKDIDLANEPRVLDALRMLDARNRKWSFEHIEHGKWLVNEIFRNLLPEIENIRSVKPLSEHDNYCLERLAKKNEEKEIENGRLYFGENGGFEKFRDYIMWLEEQLSGEDSDYARRESMRQDENIDLQLFFIEYAIKKQNIIWENLVEGLKKRVFCTFNDSKIKEIEKKLEAAKSLPFDEMRIACKEIAEEIENDRPKVGTFYAGGIVFYIDKSGKHGLVVADRDVGKAVWGGKGRFGTKSDWGAGPSNTRLIVEKASGSAALFGVFKRSTAARLCAEWVHNGYSDWFLPSEYELANSVVNFDVFGFEPLEGVYWTSSEFSEDKAMAQSFGASRNRIDRFQSRDCVNRVRAVRKF